MQFKNQYKYFNPSLYEEIFAKPSWYLQIAAEFEELIANYNKLTTEEERDLIKEKRTEFIFLLSEYLEQDKVFINRNCEGYFDDERKEIDTIVIHHSSRPAEIPIEFMNALHLLNLYLPKFLNQTKHYFGKALYSGHSHNDKPTFIAYHYMIWPDGHFEQTLEDKYIGWHCGNWDYNCRSIAITFHDDLEEKEPTEQAINTAKELIQKYNPKEILGHREILSTTVCPGNKFLGENGWKRKLINKE
jgi:hypothetical protein